jgi:enterobacteria phage integrase
MPIRRSAKRRNWPTGLYSNVVGGVTYYRYRDPITRQFSGLGTNFEVARQAAANRNAEISQSPLQKYTEKLSGAVPAKPFTDVCAAFLGDVRARRTGRGKDSRERSDKTLSDYAGYCRRFQDHFGERKPFASITLAEISDYLDTYGDKLRARNVARGLLVQIWAAGLARGWAKDNLPERTIKVAHAVARQRLTNQQFESIVSAARQQGDAWFAAACEFALYCDQRREDVSTMPVRAWNAAQDTLTFVQEKTGHAVVVRAGPKLREAIERCLAVEPSDASTIIRKPGRNSPVSDDMLTKKFSAIRDALIGERHPAWKAHKLKSKGKPTWHEVRSLGAHLAACAGKDAKQLAGHATDQVAKMYQQGHAKVFEAESL